MSWQAGYSKLLPGVNFASKRLIRGYSSFITSLETGLRSQRKGNALDRILPKVSTAYWQNLQTSKDKGLEGVEQGTYALRRA
jgi:hypothetical protein